MNSRRRSLALLLVVFFAATLCAQPSSVVFSRDVHSWEYIDAVGQKAGIFGNEQGTVEAWVYPLKFFKDFTLVFHIDGRVIPSEALARTVETRPESTTIVYVTDNFSVRETFFVPVHEAGGMIVIEADSYLPLQIEARLRPDVQLAWPASAGGTYFTYDKEKRAFLLGADDKSLFGVFGSSSAEDLALPYDTNYSSSHTVAFKLGPAFKGRKQYSIAWAGSTSSPQQAVETYSHLLTDFEALRRDSAKHYQDYLQHTVNISVPDRELQTAYDASKVAILQGMVELPGLGYGLAAGYRTSWEYRAGFDWFFGRDSMWTSMALLRMGDIENTRALLDVLAKYQSPEGKIPHEIAQTAAYVNWFKDLPSTYASADATPLFLIVARQYLDASGDVAWIKANWDHLAGAYKFLLSTRGTTGWPRNRGVGHGWVEGGPLLPVETEYYQAGLAVEALHSMAALASAAGDTPASAEAEHEAQRLSSRLDSDFWSGKAGTLAFGIDAAGKPIDRTTVLAAVPLWWRLASEEKAQKTIDAIASPTITTDWGTRIISDKEDIYDPSGYHFGAVWPLFTGWASVGEYQYHRSLAGYTALRSNALLALAGAPGRETEVMSGSFFEPMPGSCPHQIWSSAMVINPMLRGLFGVEAKADGTVGLVPHFPATWHSVSITNIHAGGAKLAVSYTRNGGTLSYRVENTGTAAARVTLSPALAPIARVKAASVDGKRLTPRIEANANDQHVTVEVAVDAGKTRVVTLQVKNDFGIEDRFAMPARGSRSGGLRFVHEEWNGNTLRLSLAGLAGQEYLIALGGDAAIATAENAEVSGTGEERRLRVHFPGDPATNTYRTTVVLLTFGK